MITFLVTILIISLSVGAVLIGRRFAKRNFFADRELLPVDRIFELDSAAVDLAMPVYNEVVSQLSKCANLDTRKIRPSDKIINIFALDSWDQSYGQDQFESWLLTRVSKNQDFDAVITVADIVKIIQKNNQDQTTID